jgi:hypothetical protein
MFINKRNVSYGKNKTEEEDERDVGAPSSSTSPRSPHVQMEMRLAGVASRTQDAPTPHTVALVSRLAPLWDWGREASAVRTAGGGHSDSHCSLCHISHIITESLHGPGRRSD